MLHVETAKTSIENFTIEENKYIASPTQNNLEISGNGKVFFKNLNTEAKIKINFRNTKGCRVFVGTNVRGNFRAFFKGNNSLLYIGDECVLKDLQVKSFQYDDFIAIGNQVTTTAKNVWISGNGAGQSNPAIIIGDDCMFSSNIVIRNSDGHPIYSLETEKQINEPEDIIHIEPHVWVGENVSILKSVKVGACSIIALGSIVTNDVPRFSIVKGSPAVSKVNQNIYWSRGVTEKARNRAKELVKRYQNPNVQRREYTKNFTTKFKLFDLHIFQSLIQKMKNRANKNT